MAPITHPENVYSFRATQPVFIGPFRVQTPSQQALAAIEAKLLEANKAFYARQYQPAITAYNATAALIYAQLDPAFSPGAIADSSQLPRDPRLFDPLLSLGAEWLNVLPVPQPAPVVRPRTPVDPALEATSLDQIGLKSATLSSRSAVDAAADWQAGRLLTDQGNPKAGAFFSTRARQVDLATVNLLEEASKAATPTMLTATPPSAGAVAAAPTTAATGPAGTTGTSVAARALGLAAVARPAGAADVPQVSPAAATALQPALAGSLAGLAGGLPAGVTTDRAYGVMVNGKTTSIVWKEGDAPPLDQLRTALYQQRAQAVDPATVMRVPVTPADVALDLPHAYFYTIPLGLAECYHALGDYGKAETYYFQAAAYQFLNAAIEAPYLWQRLATLYLDWGNAFYRADDAGSALPLYQRVLMVDGSVPNSTLYTTAALKPGADVARTVIAQLANVAALNVNPAIAAVIVEIQQQLLKIQGGLDFLGIWRSTVPIWTFDYLQSVAINFTQLAITAERDVINFWDRADQGNLTRQQIVGSVTQAQAEVQAAQLQAAAASAEVQVYRDGATLAQQRANDAAANAAEYTTKSADWIVFQAQSTQVSGGDDGDWDKLNSLADQLLSGSDISDGRGTVAGALQLAGARLNREYEVDALNRQAAEMGTALTQAQSELAAANARAAAANAATTVAQLRAQSAQQTLATFDAQFFTPDVWQQLGDTMWRLYQRYLTMALRVARLMQLAYNFETDQSLQLIKADYSTDTVKGLLGAEALMADIQTFTYDLITSQVSKPQPVRQTISLASTYGFAFENQFRKTGVMEFETHVEDFDTYFPGTYAGRLEAVEVEFDGIVPAAGISGTLTNSGISAYRLPNALWNGPGNGLKFRVQPKETLVLSDYAVRQDALLISPDQRMLRLFQGAGVASTWRLDVPRQVNDLDFGALTDVRLTFYYKARFDPDLHDRVLTHLATLPGANARQRGIPLRWIYPDAFFRFQDTGTLSFTLRKIDFRRNETNPVLTSVGLLVVTDGSAPAAGLQVQLSTPGHAAIAAPTDAAGAISSTSTAAWAPLTGGSAVGDYGIALTAAQNPALVQGGRLVLTPIVNCSLVFGYSFTPRA